MKTALPGLELKAVRYTIAGILRNALLEGRFAAGENLSEVSLAAQLGVSRGPVREALLVLAGEGLVIHSQNRGFSTLGLTPQDLADIREVRLHLEPMALRLARERISPADMEELEELKKKVLEAFTPGDVASCVAEDFAFHSSLWEKAGNRWLDIALRRIMAPHFVYTQAFKMTSTELTYDLMEERHTLYLDYLRGTCSLSAEECVCFHLPDPRNWSSGALPR